MKGFYLAALVALTTGATACGTQAAGQPAGPATTATAIPARTATASPQAAGTAPGQPPTPPQASPAATLSGPVTLTAADNGAVVRLHTGQQVAVALKSEGIFSWHVPTAAGAAVRSVSAGGGYPGQQAARAAFLAVRPGGAMLTAIDDTACLHARPACEPAQQEWRVTVTVTGG